MGMDFTSTCHVHQHLMRLMVRSRESAMFLGHLEAWAWRTRRLPGLVLGWPVDSCWLLLTHLQSFDQRILTCCAFFSHRGERINIQHMLEYDWTTWHGNTWHRMDRRTGVEVEGVQPYQRCTARCAPGALRGWIHRTQQAWSSSHFRLLGLRALLQIWVCFKVWDHPKLWQFLS